MTVVEGCVWTMRKNHQIGMKKWHKCNHPAAQFSDLQDVKLQIEWTRLVQIFPSFAKWAKLTLKYWASHIARGVLFLILPLIFLVLVKLIQLDIILRDVTASL